MNYVSLGIEHFISPSNGKPVSNGSIFIGEPDTDPEIVGNQKTVYYRQEDGTEIAAAQPIRTGGGGVPLYNGSPVQILVNGDYSIKVLNQLGAQVYYVPSNTGSEPIVVQTISDLRSLEPISGYAVNLLGYYSPGDGGGGPIRVAKTGATAGTYVDNGGSIIVPTGGNGSAAWVWEWSGPVNVLWFGAVAGTDSTDAIQAAIDIGAKSVFIPAGVYTIDNASAIGLTATGDVSIYGEEGTELVATSHLFHLMSGTSCKLDVEKVKFTGNGTVVLTGDGFPVSLLFLDQCDYSVIDGCWFNEATGAGIHVYRSVGAKVKNNKFTHTYSGSIASPFLFAAYIRLSDSLEVTGNIVDGYIQGISGGGTTDSAGTNITGLSGDVSSQLRNVLIHANHCYNQLDHSVYISNDCDSITVTDNILKSVNATIALAQGNHVVTGNMCEAGIIGFSGRNTFDTIISSNRFITTTSNLFNSGILISDTIYAVDSENIVITDNYLEHTTGESSSGLYVQGLVADGETVPNQLKNITIRGNTIVGYGKNKPEAAGIYVQQALQSVSPATGPKAENVIVDGNNISMETVTTGATYGVLMAFGSDKCVISNNNIVGINNTGVRLLGVSNSTISSNNIQGTGAFGVTEFQDDPSTAYNCRGNRFLGNTVDGPSRTVVVASEDVIVDQEIYTGTGGAVSTFSVATSFTPSIVFLNNPNDGCVVTLAGDANPIPLYRIVRVVNHSLTATISVSDTGKSIGPRGSASFIHIGSNTYIDAP